MRAGRDTSGRQSVSICTGKSPHCQLPVVVCGVAICHCATFSFSSLLSPSPVFTVELRQHRRPTRLLSSQCCRLIVSCAYFQVVTRKWLRAVMQLCSKSIWSTGFVLWLFSRWHDEFCILRNRNLLQLHIFGMCDRHVHVWCILKYFSTFNLDWTVAEHLKKLHTRDIQLWASPTSIALHKVIAIYFFKHISTTTHA